MRAAAAAVFAVLALNVQTAWAINKCVATDGKVSFQDAPCDGKGERLEVRPASGRASQPNLPPAATASPSGGSPGVAKPGSESQRLEQVVADSQKSRRRQELEVRLLPEALAAISQQQRSCDAELQQLRAKKSQAANNLAGATWEQSISGEMNAVATRCDTQTRDMRATYDILRQECVGLGGCKQAN